jgi:hypothetical protein
MNCAEENIFSKVILTKIQIFASKMTNACGKAVQKIYQDDSSVASVLCFFQGSDSKIRYETFSDERTSYPSFMFNPKEDYHQGHEMWSSVKSNFSTSSCMNVN